MKKINKMLWLYVSMILVVFFAVLSNWQDWASWAMLLPLSYIIGLVLIMGFYAIKSFFYDE